LFLLSQGPVRTKNPQEITDAIQEANKLIYTATLLHFYKNSGAANDAERKLNNLYISNPEKIEILRAKINDPSVEASDLRTYVAGVLREEGLLSGDTVNLFEDDEPDLAPACLALNLGAFVNVGMILNVVALVNVVVGFNVYQAAAVHTYTAIEVEFSASLPRLNQEKLVASIAKII